MLHPLLYITRGPSATWSPWTFRKAWGNPGRCSAGSASPLSPLLISCFGPSRGNGTHKTCPASRTWRSLPPATFPGCWRTILSSGAAWTYGYFAPRRKSALSCISSLCQCSWEALVPSFLSPHIVLSISITLLLSEFPYCQQCEASSELAFLPSELKTPAMLPTHPCRSEPSTRWRRGGWPSFCCLLIYNTPQISSPYLRPCRAIPWPQPCRIADSVFRRASHWWNCIASASAGRDTIVQFARKIRFPNEISNPYVCSDPLDWVLFWSPTPENQVISHPSRPKHYFCLWCQSRNLPQRWTRSWSRFWWPESVR